MLLIGLSSALVASFLFGSVFVPIKRQPTGDGFFAQLIMCLGATVMAVLINGICGYTNFYPLAMLGGAIWCVANAFAIKLMSILGMALGVLIWNTTSCLTGWAISRFGLFGVQTSEPASSLLNFTGVALLIVGGIIYLFIKSDISSDSTDVEKPKEKIPIEKLEEPEEISMSKRIVAIVGALVSGTFYGGMSTPITYIQQNPGLFNDAPQTGIAYLLSFFCGVIAASTLVFLVYALKTRSPFVDAAVIVPAMCSGAIFTVAMACFFTAIQYLSQTIAYPVCAMLPGLVVSAWSVLYFKEITGNRNITLLSAAYSITLVGVLFVAVSKAVAF